MTTPLLARGRGRGRGSTLPAWMTHNGGNEEDGTASAAPRQDNRGESNTWMTTSTTMSDHEHREEDRRRRQRRQRTDDKDDRNYSSSGYERGYGRDRYEWDSRERGHDSNHHHRDKDRYQDDRHDDRVRMTKDSHRSGYSSAATTADHRGNRGLGYDERGGRGWEQGIAWERDRAGGTGREQNETNFVRGREVEYGGDRGDRDRGNEDSGSRNYDRDHDDDLVVGASHSKSNVVSGMGGGRGRGRGANINAPAWMTAKSGSLGPVGWASNIDTTGAQMGTVNESMEMLLSQARKVQLKQENPSRDRQHDVTSKLASAMSDVNDSKLPKSDEQNEAIKRLEQQRQLEEAKEAARKTAEDELKRIEQLRDEEEQRQLLALIKDDSDDELTIASMEDITSKSHKNKNGVEEKDDKKLLFEFETEEEREERLARKRRDERRKKLKTIPAEQATDTSAFIAVDQPRNIAGIIHSELNNGKEGTDDDVTNTDATNNVHMDSSQVVQTIPANDGSTSNDSFDMFSTDNATPVPIHSSSNNAMGATTKSNSKHITSSTTNVQECDDAEGYYKASIGEIITLPKERGEETQLSTITSDESDRIARFRVLGIVGKGVFSSVIKCVEETNAPHSDSGALSNDAKSNVGRVIAMKIIRNNEVMAKAAAKEMRILRMLCHQPTKPKSKTRPSKTENSEENGESNHNVSHEADEDDDDGEEQVRENHHIVRLLDVDPNTAAKSKDNFYSTSVYAAPPPEFRSHCIFLFEFLPFNLREVLSKFGKHVGINLLAVRSYARQLLCALAHLERHRIVHADLKPDNILVSANFSTIKLADFGSAFFETDHDNDPTPYLVSRFYRPPEVILGLEYDRMVDLWSTAVTLGELFTGSVLFPGDTNNDMLVRFMDAMGPISHKMAKRHALSYTRMGLQPHFEVGSTGGTYQLRKQDVDRVTGQSICRLVNVLTAKADARLSQVMLRASKGGGASERVDVLTFADFLNRCLALDPGRRLSVRDALRHEFFKKKTKKE